MSPSKGKTVPASQFAAMRRVVWSSPLLSVKSAANSSGQNRFSAIIPAKKIKLSTDRHRLKRQILGLAAKLPARGRDLLFIFRGSKKPTSAEWREEFDKIRAVV